MTNSLLWSALQIRLDKQRFNAMNAVSGNRKRRFPNIVEITVIVAVIGLVLLCLIVFWWIPRTVRELNIQAEENLHQLALALHSYHEGSNTFPMGAVVDVNADERRHGWQTMLLPYVGQTVVFNQIDFHIPWNHPDNAPHFQNNIEIYLSPIEFNREPVNGFAISHIAANSWILQDNRGLKFHMMRDGQSNIILLGEAGAGFQPWGCTENTRDPAIGIGASPTQFGRSEAEGCLFVMVDGEVRFIHQSVDAEILRCLADPDDGDDALRF